MGLNPYESPSVDLGRDSGPAPSSRRFRITLVEILVIVATIGILIALLLPATEAARESARRANCLNNLKQIGLGFQNMDSTRNRFPSSCVVETDEHGNITATDGWSWAVPILPFMENKLLYDTLDLKGGKPLDGTTASADGLATPVREYSCPSFPGSQWADSPTETEYITNYKAVGATHIESLSVASTNPTVPRYNPEGDHPDGACFPGSTHGTAGFSQDGTCHTFLVVETVEQHFARWTVGDEATLVGLPPCVQFEKVSDDNGDYYAPTGFTPGDFWDRTTVDDNYTYIFWDYDSNDGKGFDGPYDGADGTVGGKYGPSSNHSGVINHAMADGSVQSICEDIDAAAYMFLITRNGNEPAPPLD